MGQGAAAQTPGQPGTVLARKRSRLAQRPSPTTIALARGQVSDRQARWYPVSAPKAFFGPPADRIDPGEAVLEELARSRGFIRDLEAQVRSLEEQELVWGRVAKISESRSGGQGGDYDLVRKEMKAEASAWWTMLANERKHYASIAAHAVRSGIEERRVRLAERGMDVLEAAFVAALTDLGIDASDTRVRTAIGSRLQQAIEQGEVIDSYATVVSSAEDAPVPVVSARADRPLQPVDF